jgi:hypothetical protein
LFKSVLVAVDSYYYFFFGEGGGVVDFGVFGFGLSELKALLLLFELLLLSGFFFSIFFNY